VLERKKNVGVERKTNKNNKNFKIGEKLCQKIMWK